jgi:hypothetical protein
VQIARSPLLSDHWVDNPAIVKNNSQQLKISGRCAEIPPDNLFPFDSQHHQTPGVTTMSGPIVRTGATPEFWENWDRIFGDKPAGDKKPAGPKKAAKKAAKKAPAAKAKKKAAPKAKKKAAKKKK